MTIPFWPIFALVSSIISCICFIIIENNEWQKRVLRDYSRTSFKKPKLKKGQEIVFQEKEVNPFEEIASANTNSK